MGSLAQQKITKLVYHQISNGIIDTAVTREVFYTDAYCFVSGGGGATKAWIDYSRKEAVNIMEFEGVLYKTLDSFSELPMAISDEGSDTIFRFPSRKSKYLAFSNTIEVWYTTEAEVNGAPSNSYFPNDGLVLKFLVNGTRGWQLARLSDNATDEMPTYLYGQAKTISQEVARELQIRSRYVNMKVFDKVQLNWGDSIMNPERGLTDVLYRFGGGTVIAKKISLPEISKKGALVYATLTNWSNGDAYDRSGSLFTIRGSKDRTMLDAIFDGIDQLPVLTDDEGAEYQGFTSTEDYEVPVELMRFFTSFGVKHFNGLRPINNYHWHDSVVYKQEITDLIPNDEEEIWLGVFIGNYDKGGHYVSLDLQFYPAWEPVEEPDRKFILPLFNTVNVLEMKGQNYGRLFLNDTLMTSFEVPDGIGNKKLYFTTTGHGGWEGGDEFNPRLNELFIDGEPVFKVVPWRSDCGTYRMANPASGNFGNGLSSSDLSRSNWCPATLTPPFIIPLTELSAGKHTIQVVIDMGPPEGNSWSAWSVSGVLTGSYGTDQQGK